jgi:hypothetical protein
MSPSQIAWIFWSGLAFVGLIGGILLFARGEPHGPDCDSSNIQATVLDLVAKNAGLGRSTFDLDDIAKTGEDPDAGTISCSATAWAFYNDTPYTSAKIAYTIARQPDGKTNVTVEGISGMRKNIEEMMPKPG